MLMPTPAIHRPHPEHSLAFETLERAPKLMTVVYRVAYLAHIPTVGRHLRSGPYKRRCMARYDRETIRGEAGPGQRAECTGREGVEDDRCGIDRGRHDEWNDVEVEVQVGFDLRDARSVLSSLVNVMKGSVDGVGRSKGTHTPFMN
jgi:hypothetical protein